MLVPLIPRRLHGAVEYAYVLLVGLSPWLAGFSDDAPAKWSAVAVAAAVLAVAVLTRAEWGVVRVVPFRANLAADVAGGLVALALPWAVGFAGDGPARWVFVGAGAFSIAAGVISDPREMPAVSA